jgi:hypothetical protein
MIDELEGIKKAAAVAYSREYQDMAGETEQPRQPQSE